MNRPASGSEMRRFWDERAREDAYFFIDNRRAYRSGELESFWRSGEEDLDKLLELTGAAVSPQDRVLDIGCGVGRLTRALAGRAARVHGIDVSAEMIERARRHNADLQNVDWSVGDGTTLAPLGDRSVDGVVSHVVFQHIPDPEVTLGYIREIARVLAPGGWAVFQVSNAPEIHRVRAPGGALNRVAVALRRRPAGQSAPQWLGSAVDMGRLRAVVADGGLDVLRIVGEGTQYCLVHVRRPA